MQVFQIWTMLGFGSGLYALFVEVALRTERPDSLSSGLVEAKEALLPNSNGAVGGMGRVGGTGGESVDSGIGRMGGLVIGLSQMTTLAIDVGRNDKDEGDAKHPLTALGISNLMKALAPLGGQLTNLTLNLGYDIQGARSCPLVAGLSVNGNTSIIAFTLCLGILGSILEDIRAIGALRWHRWGMGKYDFPFSTAAHSIVIVIQHHLVAFGIFVSGTSLWAKLRYLAS